jgi:hypothetical protein
LAITGRKSSENREESTESGITTPVNERKMMFGGETVLLQQSQQQLLEKHSPASKWRPSKIRLALPVPEAKI